MAWYGIHPATFLSIFLSMPGSQTLVCNSCFDFTISSCASWHMSMMRSCRDSGIHIWWPWSTTACAMLSSGNICPWGATSLSAFTAFWFPATMRGIKRYILGSRAVSRWISSRVTALGTLLLMSENTTSSRFSLAFSSNGVTATLWQDR